MRTNRAVRVVSAEADGSAKLIVPVLAGAAVAVTLGVYGRLHEPTGIAVNVAAFPARRR